MTPSFDTAVLTSYIHGDLPADQAAAVERAAAADPNLAAQIECLTKFAGVEFPRAPATRPFEPRPTRRRALLRAAALVAAPVALTGSAYAGWHRFLAAKPLVADDFDLDIIDATKWETSLGRRVVRAENGYVRLMDRGSIVTSRQFPEPIEVCFDWMWIDLSGDRQYSEDLKIALRTTGRHFEKHSFEIRDGVVVRFSTRGNTALIDVGEPDVPPPARKTRTLDERPSTTIPLPAGVWHHIRITDDGRTIAVYLRGPKIDGKYATEPVVQAVCEDKFAQRRIAIYNREFVADSRHESRIDNFAVWKLGDR